MFVFWGLLFHTNIHTNIHIPSPHPHPQPHTQSHTHKHTHIKVNIWIKFDKRPELHYTQNHNEKVNYFWGGNGISVTIRWNCLSQPDQQVISASIRIFPLTKCHEPSGVQQTLSRRRPEPPQTHRQVSAAHKKLVCNITLLTQVAFTKKIRNIYFSVQRKLQAF